MPKAAEEALKKKARKKFGSTTSPAARRYIWGTMNKIEKAQAKKKKKK